MDALSFDLQILNTLAALLLLLSFAMLSQRRIVTLVNLLAVQGALLCTATLLLAWRTGANHLYHHRGEDARRTQRSRNRFTALDLAADLSNRAFDDRLRDHRLGRADERWRRGTA